MICTGKKTAACIAAGFLALTALLPAQTFSDTLASAQVFQLDVKKDAIIWGAELTGEVYHNLYDHFALADDDDWDGKSFDKDSINPLDRALMHSYSKKLDTAGDAMVATTIALPFLTGAAFLWQDPRYGGIDLLTDTVMFAEALAISHTLAHITKGLVLRTRPYNYYAGDEATEDDWNRSFYSGHTTMAFAAATFTSYTFCNYFPESSWKIPLVAASYGLACTTGIVRVEAGCHFATDVLVGAMTGAAIGFLVPWCHKVSAAVSSDRLQVSLAPTGAAVTLRL